jgi:hypothetical protein
MCQNWVLTPRRNLSSFNGVDTCIGWMINPVSIHIIRAEAQKDFETAKAPPSGTEVYPDLSGLCFDKPLYS